MQPDLVPRLLARVGWTFIAAALVLVSPLDGLLPVELLLLPQVLLGTDPHHMYMRVVAGERTYWVEGGLMAVGIVLVVLGRWIRRTGGSEGNGS